MRTVAALFLAVSSIALSAQQGRQLSASETRSLLARIVSLRKRCSVGHAVVTQSVKENLSIRTGDTLERRISEYWSGIGRYREKTRGVNYDGRSVQEAEVFTDGLASYMLIRRDGRLIIHPNSTTAGTSRLDDRVAVSPRRAPAGEMAPLIRPELVGAMGEAATGGITLGPLGPDPSELGRRVTAYDEGNRYRLVGREPKESRTILIKKSLAPIAEVDEGTDVTGHRYHRLYRYSGYVRVDGVECSTHFGNLRYSDLSFRPPASKDLDVPLASIRIFQIDVSGSPVTVSMSDVRNGLHGRELSVPNLLEIAQQRAASNQLAFRSAADNAVRLRNSAWSDNLPQIVLGAIAVIVLVTVLFLSAMRALRNDKPPA